MIRLTAAQARLIEKLAIAAWPKECCGLLIGRRAEAGLLVDEVRPCKNLLADQENDRFEIDPQERFDAMRQARSMEREILGHYHSHPNGVAAPSKTDREQMYEPELTWLIVGVTKAGDCRLAAFRPNLEREDFDPVGLVIGSADDQNCRS
ncbi:Mov34/MPN/PAD-1 [Rhodospirillaceae bacterium LM-1]|nr:Mov34/MPN/PAD-1 [Rhodospirillaceae bacterium LM-1]